MPALLAIALGGALGSLARFGVARATEVAVGGEALLPWATLAVNVIGCFVIGIAAIRSGPAWRPFLITGVLGGFTTVSAFALEAGVLLDRGRTVTAVVYVLVTLGACLAAVTLGERLARARS